MPFKQCCNLFQKNNHRVRNNLIKIYDGLVEKALALQFNLNTKQYICFDCKVELIRKFTSASSQASNIDQNVEQQSSSEISTSESSPEKRISPPLPDVQEEELKDLNNFLKRCGEGPIEKKHINSSLSYDKIASVVSILSARIFNVAPPEINYPNEENESKTWMNNLKKAFEVADSKEKKIFMLTTLPRSYWPNSRIAEEFKAPRRLVAEAMRLVEKNGPFSFCEERPSREYPPDILSKVHEFYCSDEISSHARNER